MAVGQCHVLTVMVKASGITEHSFRSTGGNANSVTALERRSVVFAAAVAQSKIS